MNWPFISIYCPIYTHEIKVEAVFLNNDALSIDNNKVKILELIFVIQNGHELLCAVNYDNRH